MNARSGRNAELVMVRHGETVGESSIRYHGRNDVALSELGRAQMRAARRAIANRGGHGFTHVFASPLSRASESASIIAGADARIVTFKEFEEVHFGAFEGLTLNEIRDRFPTEYEAWRRDPLSDAYTYPGGESRAIFTARVERGAAMVLELWRPESAAGRALLVAHRGVIRTIVKLLAGQQPAVELGSIQILEFDGAWNALALDMIDHLRNTR